MAKFATNARGAMWLPNLVQVTESISGSVLPLAMFCLLVFQHAERPFAFQTTYFLLKIPTLQFYRIYTPKLIKKNIFSHNEVKFHIPKKSCAKIFTNQFSQTRGFINLNEKLSNVRSISQIVWKPLAANLRYISHPELVTKKAWIRKSAHSDH